MTISDLPDIDSLRDALAQLRRDSARIVARMHVGAQRKERRELERQLAACRKRGKALEPKIAALLHLAEGDDKDRLEKDAYFLSQLRSFGLAPEQTAEPA